MDTDDGHITRFAGGDQIALAGHQIASVDCMISPPAKQRRRYSGSAAGSVILSPPQAGEESPARLTGIPRREILCCEILRCAQNGTLGENRSLQRLRHMRRIRGAQRICCRTLHDDRGEFTLRKAPWQVPCYDSLKRDLRQEMT